MTILVNTPNGEYEYQFRVSDDIQIAVDQACAAHPNWTSFVLTLVRT